MSERRHGFNITRVLSDIVTHSSDSQPGEHRTNSVTWRASRPRPGQLSGLVFGRRSLGSARADDCPVKWNQRGGLRWRCTEHRLNSGGMILTLRSVSIRPLSRSTPSTRLAGLLIAQERRRLYGGYACIIRRSRWRVAIRGVSGFDCAQASRHDENSAACPRATPCSSISCQITPSSIQNRRPDLAMRSPR